MKKWLVNQDRDEIVRLDNPDLLHMTVVVNNGKVFGFNLNYADDLMGTFDTKEEVEQELHTILNSEAEICVVSGFSDSIYF